MNVAKQLGHNVARCRKAAGLSQEEFSYGASLHRTAISQIERGLRCPKADTIAKLAGTLGVEAGEFFEGIVWEPGAVCYGHFRKS